jgi:site-specific DNA-cytosine methylase
MKRLLELFCGTKCVGKVFQEHGYEVVSLDYNPKFNATHTADILTWDYTQYPQDYFDVIWASPDCTTWSVASGGKYRTKANIYGLNNDMQLNATIGNNMVLRMIEILKYFKCGTWFMENPRGLMIHFPPLQQFIKETNANVTCIYYGNYGWAVPKATNIWSNIPLWNEKSPNMTEDTYTIHTKGDGTIRRYYKGFKFKTAEERSKIPDGLIHRLRRLIPNEV